MGGQLDGIFLAGSLPHEFFYFDCHIVYLLVVNKFFFSLSVHQTAKLAAVLLRVAGVTAGLAESNGSLPPGL